MNTVTITNPITGEEEIYPVITVTCQNADCENHGVDFDVPDSNVQCGACGHDIIPEN